MRTLKIITTRVWKGLQNNWHVVVLCATFILYVVFVSYASIVRVLSLHSNYYDLGIMDQTVYNTASGQFLELSNPALLKNTSRLAIHFDPILAVFAPFYLVRPSPFVLLTGQSVILAAGCFAVFYIAHAVTKSKPIALVFSILYLAYYPLQNSNLFDFHAVNIATTGLLFMFLFLVVRPLATKRYNILLGLFAGAISLLCKEDIPLATGSMAFLYFFLGKERKLWLLLLFISAVCFYIEVSWILPFFNGHSASSLKYYDLQHPLMMIARSLTFDNLMYLVKTLLPFGFLSLFAPFQFMLAVPQMLVNIFSSNSNMSTLYYQYSAPVTPFVVISAVYGYQNMAEKLHHVRARIQYFLMAAVVLIGMYLNITNSNLYGSFYPINHQDLKTVIKWQTRLSNKVLIIATSGTLAPFFTERRYFIDFLFDPSYKNTGISPETLRQQVNKYEKADYVLIYKPDMIFNDQLVQYYYQHLKTNANFAEVDETDSIAVYKK